MSETALTIIINTVGIIILLTFHEWGHAKSANLLGDRTAEYQGRMTLNPAAHIDPIGTVILPVLMQLGGGAFFGWAKPVPVDSRMLKNPKRDMMLIAAAGPFMNLLLSFSIFAIYAILVTRIDPRLLQLIGTAGYISVVLAVFNLIPLHPLDGFSVLYGLLPDRYAYEFSKTQPYGFIVLIGLLFLLPMVGIDVFRAVLLPIVELIAHYQQKLVFAIF